MRLSPKSIFFGLVALGLPVAVTIGWQLAAPPSRSAALDPPSGAGGIGNAPEQPSPSATITHQAAYTGAPTHTATASPAAVTTTRVVAATVTPSVDLPTASATPSDPATEASDDDALPPLTMPPVPTPTDPGSPDPTDTLDDPPPSFDQSPDLDKPSFDKPSSDFGKPGFNHHWRR